MFKKYARAVDNERERKDLFVHYVLGVVFAVITYLLLAVSFVATFMIEDGMPLEQVALLENVMVFSALGFTLFGIGWLIVHITFKARFKAIVKRSTYGTESPQVAEYRQNVVNENQTLKKRTGWSVWVMIVCIAVSVGLIVVDTIKNPESEEISSPIFIISVAVAVLGILTNFFANYFAKLKSLEAGNTAEQASDVQQIDAMQGRKYKYKTHEDKNLQNYKYLFPTEELRSQIEELNAKRQKQTSVCLIIGVVVAFVIATFAFGGEMLFGSLQGYFVPVFLTAYCIVSTVPSILFTVRGKPIENKQKEILLSDPSLALNLQVFNLYDDYGKKYGFIPYLSMALSIVGGYVLAILFPETMYSALTIILYFVLILIQSKQVQKLRIKAIEIERQIDGE